MTDSLEKAQLRQHLAEIRKAMKGIGRDFSLEVQHLDRRIGQLSDKSGQSTERAVADIRQDLAKLGQAVEEEARNIPSQAASAGRWVGSAAKETAEKTADAVAEGAHKAREGTQEMFARAAGVKRKPMRQWTPPPDDADSGKGSG